MKRILLVGLIITALSLTAGFAVPVFAHGPTEGGSGTPDQETWQAMHEACEEGDWDAMVEATIVNDPVCGMDIEPDRAVATEAY